MSPSFKVQSKPEANATDSTSDSIGKAANSTIATNVQIISRLAIGAPRGLTTLRVGRVDPSPLIRRKRESGGLRKEAGSPPARGRAKVSASGLIEYSNRERGLPSPHWQSGRFLDKNDHTQL